MIDENVQGNYLHLLTCEVDLLFVFITPFHLRL
jgi:hypothetical protein